MVLLCVRARGISQGLNPLVEEGKVRAVAVVGLKR